LREKKVITNEQKFEYMDEHLPYVLKMVRHDFKKINNEQNQLDWNSYFQSFAVSARNLVVDLTNADKDNRNVRAGDFVEGFRARKGDISGPMIALDTQVFHLGKNRSREADRKFNIENAKSVLEWIDDSMKQFLEALAENNPNDRKNWNANKSDCSKDDRGPATRGPTGPGTPFLSASSSVTSTVTTALSKINQTSSVSSDFKVQKR
jgi:hypothetical protein